MLKNEGTEGRLGDLSTCGVKHLAAPEIHNLIDSFHLHRAFCLLWFPHVFELLEALILYLPPAGVNHELDFF